MTISPGTLQSGDNLLFNNQNGISGSYSGGVLTLTGTATTAQYQAALRSVTFYTTSTNTTTRALSIVARDGVVTGNAAAESINVTLGPVVTASGTTNIYTVGGSAVAVDSQLNIFSSYTSLSGATITISAGTLQSADTLKFTNQNGISGSLLRRPADVERQRHASPIPDGFTVGHLYDDQPEHDHPLAFDRRH